ncbi:GNAT family N-acetyltransferase [Kribbella jiaozuonensis]|uniref:GNAT family N-acetyltransferase n=1 Tax=Kribbella jiaozuonensis TaxID=2575441 RepID=A0A4U3LU07_9ACTN|nr:GNAT family N-acetyltransferase [Kribbella jiaozuonensis]TKK79290.1 GNAT family N-acetyltransferase [Kribbella jiaozuonensis]
MILIRHPGAPQPTAVPGVVLRPPSVADTVELGHLYFASYDPGIAAESEQAALEDINLTFEGGYGVLSPTLSRLAWAGDQLVGALLTVERAPWPDTPDCPFIIELFTAPSHRRLGIARLLLNHCADATVALRVEDNNLPALTLYRSAGFRSVADGN